MYMNKKKIEESYFIYFCDMGNRIVGDNNIFFLTETVGKYNDQLNNYTT